MQAVDIKEHPAYTCNVYALKVGAPATFVSAFFALTYPAPYNLLVTAGILLLSAVFFIAERYLLPRIKSLRTLDCFVVTYCFAIAITQWVSVTCYPEYEVSTGVGCMIVLSALLFYSTTWMAVYVALSVTSWIVLKWYGSGSLSPQDAMQLYLIAPLIALIVRITLFKTVNAMFAARLREQENVVELRATLEKLREETRLREMTEAQLQRAQKNEGLGIMAAGVAHDFNNTLAAINAFAEVIELESRDNVVQVHATEIAKAVKQASSICKQMLTYAGKSTSQMLPIDLVELTQSLRLLMQATCGKRIPVSMNTIEPPQFVMGNAAQLQQVLLNLVNNGADAIAGKGSIDVSIRTVQASEEFAHASQNSIIIPEQQGELIALTVRDSGCGMDKETMRQMFDPYFTTKGVGHGFGLSNVLGIARSHKASLSVVSEVGRGTSITIYFTRVELDSNSKIASGLPAMTELPAKRNTRVLLVDDDSLVRDSLAEVLAYRGWQVCKADSGLAAVNLVKQNGDYAALIIDFSMPHMDGGATLRELRSLGCTSPAILCSGHISAPTHAAVLKEFQAYLPKPYERLELEATLQRLTGSAN